MAKDRSEPKPDWARKENVVKEVVPPKWCRVCAKRKIYAGAYFAGTAKECPFCGSPV